MYHEEKQELDLFVVNRSLDEEMELDLDATGFSKQLRIIEHITLHHTDLKAVNEKDNPENIKPVVKSGKMNKYIAPRQSWNLFRFSIS